MARSIIPPGFECTSHKIFFQYINPVSEIALFQTRKKQKKKQKQQNEEERIVPSSSLESASLSLSNSNYQDICSICLSSYDNPVTLVICHHSYCLNCLLLWLNKKPQCPLCKADGSYFIQSNRYSSSKKDVKLLTINPTPQTFSSTLLDETIQIHRRRFPLKSSNNCSDIHDPLKNRRKILDRLIEERRKPSIEEYSSPLNHTPTPTPQEITNIINQIEQQLHKNQQRLQQIDQEIYQRKKRKFDDKLSTESEERRGEKRRGRKKEGIN